LLHLGEVLLLGSWHCFGALRTHPPTLKHWLVQLDVVLNLLSLETAIVVVDLVSVLINGFLVLRRLVGGCVGHLLVVLRLDILVLFPSSVAGVAFAVMAAIYLVRT
jgi:hypothetical protein